MTWRARGTGPAWARAASASATKTSRVRPATSRPALRTASRKVSEEASATKLKSVAIASRDLPVRQIYRKHTSMVIYQIIFANHFFLRIFFIFSVWISSNCRRFSMFCSLCNVNALVILQNMIRKLI